MLHKYEGEQKYYCINFISDQILSKIWPTKTGGLRIFYFIFILSGFFFVDARVCDEYVTTGEISL